MLSARQTTGSEVSEVFTGDCLPDFTLTVRPLPATVTWHHQEQSRKKKEENI